MGIFFGACLMIAGCISTQQSFSALPDSALFQEWRHSYEEDTEDLKIYRPSSFNFPLGWGRTGMKIDRDGGFMSYDIAPNDAIVQVPGNWKQISESRLQVTFPSGDKETFILEIEELNSQILKAAK